MAEPPSPAADAEGIRRSPYSVVVENLDIVYRVFEDRRPTLRHFVANRLRPRPYREVQAVSGVSFAVEPGEAVGIVGRNGSGKSTLLKAMAGLLPPRRGAVYAHDTPVLLGVSAALQQELSGRRNVYLGATAMGMTRRQVEERFDDIVEFAGVEDFIDMPMRAYSSGMRQRLQFSIATAVRPEILLVDEALATGDQEFRQKSRGRIQGLLDGAGTVFIVSHGLGLLRSLVNRALWMDEGSVVADGEADEVIDRYLEETEGGEPDPTGRASVETVGGR